MRTDRRICELREEEVGRPKAAAASRTKPAAQGAIRRAVLAGLGLLGAALATASQAGEQVPRSEEQITLSFAPVVRAAAPAVVNIYSRRALARSPLHPRKAQRFLDFDLEKPETHERQRQREDSLGSGVIIGTGGLIVTNHHVIKDADEILVVLADGREFRAEVIGADQPADLALLEIDRDGLPALRMGDSDALKIGDLVLAIGNPFGIGQAVTSGIVSALERAAPENGLDFSLIQTDAAINPGNSGGALVTIDGSLVGINTATFTRSGGTTGISFAIPVNLVKALIRSVEGGGDTWVRAWLGAAVERLDHSAAAALGLVRPMGVLVGPIHPNGPAARAGLSEGDVILALNGHLIPDPETLDSRLAVSELGDRAELSIWRRDRRTSLHLPLEAPPYHPEPKSTKLRGYPLLEGATVANLSPGLNNDLDIDLLKRGVVVLKIEPGSPAARLPLREGDFVAEVNDQEIMDVNQLRAVLDYGWLPSRLEVERGGRRFAVVITPTQ